MYVIELTNRDYPEEVTYLTAIMVNKNMSSIESDLDLNNAMMFESKRFAKSAKDIIDFEHKDYEAKVIPTP